MSSPEERSPKRQRRSYSPASPPQLDTKNLVHPPQTPPPSVHMSPYPQGESGVGATFQSPPSVVGLRGEGMPEQSATEGEISLESGQHAPEAALVTAAEVRNDEEDGEGDMAMEDRPSSGEQSRSRVADGAEHRRTDHERDAGVDVEDEAVGAPPEAPRLYRLATQPIAPLRPHPNENVIELYGLQRIQASVARKDAAGNKINKLRKSYENKVKNLGLEGRSKAQVGNAALQGLVDPGWDMDIGGGVTAWQARSSELQLGGPSIEDVLGKLDSALALAAGHLPSKEHEQWKNLLGLDDVAAKATPALNATKPTTANPLLAKTAPGAAVRNSAPASPRTSARPVTRPGKRRRYDESTYEGYDDGYDDDGYSTGGLDDSGRRNSGAKRQKVQRKDFPAASSPPFASSSNSMVGVQTS